MPHLGFGIPQTRCLHKLGAQALKRGQAVVQSLAYASGYYGDKYRLERIISAAMVATKWGAGTETGKTLRICPTSNLAASSSTLCREVLYVDNAAKSIPSAHEKQESLHYAPLNTRIRSVPTESTCLAILP